MKSSDDSPVLSIQGGCLHTIFERQAFSQPNLVALRSEHDSLSYRRLNDLANQLAYKLIELGVGRDVRVGLALERSFEMVIAIFAVLKAGGAYVPVDPDYPNDRIQFILKDASVNLLIIQEKYDDKFRSYPQQLLKPDTGNWAYDQYSVNNPDTQVENEDLAYILFTSGSTGQPKGVMVEHHSVVNLIACIQRKYPIGQAETVLFKSPYTFDGSVWELFGWIIPAGTLFVATPGIERDPARLLDTILVNRIGFTFFVSSMLSVFLENIEISGNAVAAGKLKWVSVGGEVVSPLLVQRFYKIFGESGTCLFNVYGPTETTVYATTYLCRSADTEKTPVGEAIDHDFIYVLDENQNLLEPMVEGEIFIGGAGVARGYLNRPELDAQKFIQNPFRPGEKMYATGDIGRFLPDGNLDFIGRRDFQVKLRGLRIELGEIEFALHALPEIHDAVVTVLTDQFNDLSLIAFIIPEPGSGILSGENPVYSGPADHERITRELENSLPGFMIPSAFVVCRSFPLTENGKLDRKALLLPVRLNDRTDGFTAPATPEEIWLAETWQEVLLVPGISIHDSFFKLGGHSLKAARIASRITREFEIEMPIKTIFQNPTIHALAGVLKNLVHDSPKRSTAICRVERTHEGYPLNANQLELWFLHKMDATRIQHNILFRLDITGEPDHAVFEEAINRLILVNESLRTAFVVTNGVPLQYICDPYRIIIPYTVLSELAPNETALFLDDKRKLIGQQLFDLETGRLFTFDWFKLSEKGHIVYFCIHHIIFDGWSMFNFFNGVKQSYLNLSGGSTEGLKDIEIQNVDLAVFQQDVAYQDKLLAQLNYWMEIFKNPPSQLSLRGRKKFDLATVAQAGKRIWWTIPADELATLKLFTIEHDCSLFSLMLSVYKIMLCRFSGHHDIVVGTPYANRYRAETEPLIGYFTNMLAIRNSILPDESFPMLVKRLQSSSLDAFANAAVPFGQIVRSLGLLTSPGNYPLFQVVFVMQNWAMPDMKFAGIELEQKELGSGGVKAELMLNAEETGNELECWLEYDLSLFDDNLVNNMVDFMSLSLQVIAGKPSISVGELLNPNQDPKASEAGFSCILIGETGMLVECGKSLIRHGFSIIGLVSPDAACRTWAKSIEIQRILDYHEFQPATWEQGSYDYLFSIINSKILKKEHLAGARKACINYHDSLLPAYGGVHATSWAMMMGEEEHGVSWHMMTEEVDAGGVVASSKVKIGRDDMVLELNARCFEAAIGSFNQLISEIINNTCIPGIPQRPDSWFGLHQKPSASALIDFRRPARELYNMIRALNFGEVVDNGLANPKLITEQGVYVITRANISGNPSFLKPGTIQNKTNEELSIATSEDFLVIRGIATLLGEPAELNSVFSGNRIHSSLPLLPSDRLALIDRLTQNAAPFEQYWIKKLSLFPGYDSPRTVADEAKMKTVRVPVSVVPGQDLQASLLFFLACYTDSVSGITGISTTETCLAYDDSYAIFADAIPFTLPSILDLTCDIALEKIGKELTRALSMATFPFDVIGRIPELRRKFSKVRKPEYDFIVADSIATALSVVHRYPVTVVLVPDKMEITIVTRCSPEMENLMSRIPLFFARLAEHYTQSVTLVNMLDSAELNIHELVNTQWDLSDIPPFFRQFDQQVASRGHRVAIEFESERLTYLELQRQSNQVAGFILSRLNHHRGKVLGICLERSPAFIVSILGVLRSGCAYLPLDPGMPPERMRQIFTDSGVSDVFSANRYKDIFPDDVTIHDVNRIVEGTGSVDAPGDVLLREHSPAYVIYTSGTSGKPKGVVITHHSLDVFIKGCIRRYSLTGSDRLLQFAALTFDASVEEIFPTLASGATLVLRTDASISSVKRFIEFCHDRAISVLDLPSAFWHQLVDYPDEVENIGNKLRLVIIGGEKAGKADVEKWLGSPWKEYSLFNTYGPTETTVVATAYELSKQAPVIELPVGKPVFGATARIRNGFGQLSVPGSPGELHIGGDILFAGYLHQLDTNGLNPEFLADATRSDRWYATGDLVTILPDGNLVFAGRKDDQLKIRGFRVEISEIRDAVNQLSMVHDCIVVPLKNAGKELTIAAYVVMKEGFSPDVLTTILQSKLPGYMIPAHFIGIPFIPMTVNHKPDLQALPIPDFSIGTNTLIVKATTRTERVIFASWEKQLGTSKFGIDHDFFKLGGHSLMALAIMSELERETGKAIPLASLFTFPTVRTLAAAIDHDREIEGWRSLVCIRPGTDRIPLFIIHGGGLNILLFNTLADKMAPGQPVYGIQAHGLDGKTRPYDHIDDIAGHYMHEIRSVLPHGPYALAGFSIGGLIAHELCCRFVEQGDPVVFLGMFDTEAMTLDQDMKGFLRALFLFREKIRQALFNIRIIITDPVNAIPKKFKWLKYRVKMNLLDMDAVNREDLVDLPAHLIYIAKANIKAISNMKLRYFPGKLHLFRARKRNFYVAEPEFLGWQKYASEVIVHPIPGEHTNIFAPPNDTEFAEVLQRCLDETGDRL